METKTIKGSELSEKDLEIINYYRVREFDLNTKLTLGTDNELINQYCVTVRNNLNELVGFCRLHSITLKIKHADIEILGLATVFTSDEFRGKGVGALLMAKIIELAERKEKSIVGFSMGMTSGFYKKTGFKVIEALGDRFVYKQTEDNHLVSKYGNDNVIVKEINTDLIKLLEKDKHVRVYISEPHW